MKDSSKLSSNHFTYLSKISSQNGLVVQISLRYDVEILIELIHERYPVGG